MQRQKEKEKVKKIIMQKYGKKSERSEKVHASIKRSKLCLHQAKIWALENEVKIYNTSQLNRNMSLKLSGRRPFL